jgi:galactokinase
MGMALTMEKPKNLEAEIRATASLFRKQFGFTPPFKVKAPGRLELLGNHTDYNQGLVMSIAVDKYIFAACSPRIDGKIELISSAYPDVERFSVSRIEKNPAASWADYVKGVLLELRKKGVHFGGFNAAIHSSLPMGAGMSSSAALEVATALIVRELFPYSLGETGTTAPPTRGKGGVLRALRPAERIQMARVCQAAENNFVGVNCGLLDQISSLCGKAFHAIEIDCQSTSVRTIPMFGDIAIVIANSGVKHSLVGGEYNELREQCESAARKLRVKALRMADSKMLQARKKLLNEREYACAYHVIGEIQRVIFGERALQQGDFEQFGEYMFQSHESSRDFFKNSTAELDLLVELARSHPACLGARLTGGGFGGATINLVKRDRIGLFREFLAEHYLAKTGIEMIPLLCQIVDGAA